MKKFKKIIFIVYTLLFFNLIISKNLFSTVILFLFPNLYFSIFPKLSQKNINKILFFELIVWALNSYVVIINNFDLWFLALNNLLWLLTSIKIIEVKNDINIKNIIILLLLSIGTSSLFSISFTSNLINIISLFILLFSLLVLNKYKSENIIKQLIILISFLPLTLISLINIPSPKPWMNLNSNTIAKTGMSNELKPGDISSLAQSEDLVGRVYFNYDLPKPKNRYWRVIVFEEFKNNTWFGSTKNIYKDFYKEKDISIKTKNLKIPNDEKWILEPSNIRERPWSGKGNSLGNNLLITDKGILLGRKELRKREHYGILYTDNQWREKPPKKTNFNFEEIKNKSLYKLSRKWLEESSNPEEIIEKSKEWFLREEIRYTINPGLMNKNAPYDDFLFQKKKGFCEHFAGSFALLMKYAEIPVRVVIGYQGGEVIEDSKNNKYILIDNSYAHAWNEVWIKKKGWVRIDPTAWVSPDRIQESSTLITKNESKFLNFTNNLNFQLINNLTKIELGFGEIANNISEKLKIFKFSDNLIFNRIYSILFLLSILLLSVFIVLLIEAKHKNNVIRYSLNIYFNLLSNSNLKRKKGETLKSFSLRINKYHPTISKEVNAIYKSYNNYKFSKEKLSTYEFLELLIKLIYCEIKVLSYLAISALKFHFIKFRK